MDNLKSTYREGEETDQGDVRKADGDESLADKIGNAGDDIRKDAGNAGDDLRQRRERPGETTLAARPHAATTSTTVVGNAGDDIRAQHLTSRLGFDTTPPAPPGAFPVRRR